MTVLFVSAAVAELLVGVLTLVGFLTGRRSLPDFAPMGGSIVRPLLFALAIAAAGVVTFSGIHVFWIDKEEGTDSITSPSSADTVVTPTWRHLKTGEAAAVTDSDFVVGDIQVDGVPLYDSDDHTGLVVTFSVSATIYAPYGADLLTVSNSANKKAAIDARNEVERAAHPEFSHIDTITYTGSGTQRQE